MNRDEWLACTDPQMLLDSLGARSSNRQLRLFACACCRRIWHRLTDPRSRRAVEIAEPFADHSENPSLRQVMDRAAALAYTVVGDDTFRANAHAAGLAAHHTSELPFRYAVFAEMAARYAAYPGNAMLRAAQCKLLRDIVPWRVVPFLPSWRSAGVFDLARAIYEHGAFERLPALAGNLEHAGCDQADIIDHCRRPRVHVRGCWVVDLVLGKD